ncbi:LmeA family phospholipid-binding protein [Streptomyces sp. NPDC004059]
MVLAVLLTVADRVAVHYADKEATHLAAEKYDYDNSTDGHLDVSIEGFSFLTQAFSQKFGHVNLPGLKAEASVLCASGDAGGCPASTLAGGGVA